MKKKIISLIFIVSIFFIAGNLIYGQLADLRIKIKCPGSAIAGQDLKQKISVFVTNTGKVAAKDFPVDLIISKDAFAPMKYAIYSSTFKEDALLLGGREFVKYLGPGKTKAVKLNGSNRIPADTTTGVYFLGAIVDAGDKVKEINERNNMDFCKLKVKGKDFKIIKGIKTPVKVVTPFTPETPSVVERPDKKEYEISRICPDPAAYAVRFRIIEKLTNWAAKVRITGVVKNVGTKAFSGGGGTAYLYEIDGRDTYLRNEKKFSYLGIGEQFSLYYERDWNISSPMEGEFPPEYKLLILYDAGILEDGNTNNDDCNMKNNKKVRSGKRIRSIW